MSQRVDRADGGGQFGNGEDVGPSHGLTAFSFLECDTLLKLFKDSEYISTFAE
jgi:hypothetical protein